MKKISSSDSSLTSNFYIKMSRLVSTFKKAKKKIKNQNFIFFIFTLCVP